MDKMTHHCDEKPSYGDVYVCGECKMTLTVTRDCCCDDVECVCLCCCGKPLTKVN